MRNGSTTLLSLAAAFVAVAGLATLEPVEVSEPWDEWDRPRSDFIGIDEAGGGLAVSSNAHLRHEVGRHEVAAAEPLYQEVRGVPPVSAAATAVSPVIARTAREFDLDRPSGAGIEGRLEANAAGHFVPNESARRLFEGYYAKYARQSDELVRGRVVLQILDTLPPRAADEAIGVLDRWRASRKATGALDPGASEQQVREARAEALGAELATALYGES